MRVTVRFGHSDLLRIVWHGHYVQWLEDARQSLGSAIGLGYEDLIQLSYAAPIVDMHLAYRRPARYGDDLDVTAKLVWQETPKLVHHYEVRRVSDGEVLTKAETVQVLLNPDGELVLNFPPFLTDLRRRWLAGEIKLPDTPLRKWA